MKQLYSEHHPRSEKFVVNKLNVEKTGSFISGYCTDPGSSVGSVRSGGTEVAGSIPGHDISKSLKMILAAFRLPLPIYEIVTCKRPCRTGYSGDTVILKKNAEFLPHHRPRSPGELRGFDSRF